MTLTHDPGEASTVHESLRERKKQGTRIALKHAAVELALERGVQATSIDDICERAGVSSRTFFNYFPSKMSAIVGIDDHPIDESLRQQFISGAAGGGILHDTCQLVAEFVEHQSTEPGASGDRERRRELVREDPRLLDVGFVSLIQVTREVVELVAQRVAAERAAERAAAGLRAAPDASASASASASAERGAAEPTAADRATARILTTFVIAALSCVVRDPDGYDPSSGLALPTYTMARHMQSLP